jgi:hypothetical protein
LSSISWFCSIPKYYYSILGSSSLTF